jgi:hypothetical protein
MVSIIGWIVSQIICSFCNTIGEIQFSRELVRKIDLRVICREKDMELSHSECARMITHVKITTDRSKCLRTNKRVLDKYLMNSLSEEAVEDSMVIGLQFAGKPFTHT